MKTYSIKNHACVTAMILMIVAFFGSVFVARAESVQYNTVHDGTLCSNGVGWSCATKLYNPNMTVKEHAQVVNVDTGAPIACGSSVSQGTHIKFLFVPHVSEDIDWFGTGGGLDSPYGDWVAGAAEGPQCAEKDKISNELTSARLGSFYLHFSLTVNPPVKSMNGLDGLGCTDAAGSSCNTPTPGTYDPVFNFAQTYGHFYGYYNQPDNSNMYYGCHGGPMYTVDKATADASRSGAGLTPITPDNFYTLNIPVQQISCPITVIGPNTPNAPNVPNAPVITDIGSCVIGSDQTYSLKSTHADVNAQLRYGIDWNNDGAVDQWVPTTGYVLQGVPQNVTHHWTGATGSRTFRVIAEDSQGYRSAWTSHTVSCTAAAEPPIVIITSTPTEWGSASTIQWSSSGATSCTGTGFDTNGMTSGTYTTEPLTQTTTYGVSCVNAVGTDEDTTTAEITSCPAGYTGTPPVCTLASNTCPVGYEGTPPNCSVAASCPLNYTGTPPNCVPDDNSCIPSNICNGNNVVNSCTGAIIQSCAYSCTNGACVVPPPTVVSWTVAPLIVNQGHSTNVSWEVRNVSSCTVSGTNGDSWTGLTGTKVSGPINSQTIFTLHCIALAGSNAANVTRTATVNIVPVFNEK